MGAHDKSTPAIVSIISGGTAGAVEAAVTYPFEFAKTRVQLQTLPSSTTAHPRNPLTVLLRVYRTEGLRAIYKGCSVLVIGSVGKDAVRFLSFDTVKNLFKDPETGALSPARNMLSGMAAGVVASATAVTPTERIKTALIDDARGVGGKGTTARYRNTWHCIRSVLAEDGFVGLYRGFVGTTLKQASATSFRMGSYNIIKDAQEKKGLKQNPSVHFVNGSIAGVVTTLCTQPFDVIKTRSQAKKITTTVQAIRGIWEDGGVRGFWRGTTMRLGRTVFSGGVLFTTAEAVANILNPVFKKERLVAAI